MPLQKDNLIPTKTFEEMSKTILCGCIVGTGLEEGQPI